METYKMISQEQLKDEIFPTARDIVYEKNKDKTLLRKKIMQLRYQLKQKGITKKGHNSYQNYDHYTIDDILEQVYPLLIEYNISTWYQFDKQHNTASLEITDLETGYTDTVNIEDPTLQYKNANDALQGIGKTQTYLRKYLYIQFLDLSETDPDTNFGKPYETHKQKNNIKTEQTIQSNQSQPNLTQKQINDALDQCYNNIVTIAGKPFTEAAAIFQLGRLYKNNPELIQACKKSLQDYINNKQK